MSVQPLPALTVTFSERKIFKNAMIGKIDKKICNSAVNTIANRERQECENFSSCMPDTEKTFQQTAQNRQLQQNARKIQQ